VHGHVTHTHTGLVLQSSPSSAQSPIIYIYQRPKHNSTHELVICTYTQALCCRAPPNDAQSPIVQTCQQSVHNRAWARHLHVRTGLVLQSSPSSAQSPIVQTCQQSVHNRAWARHLHVRTGLVLQSSPSSAQSPIIHMTLAQPPSKELEAKLLLQRIADHMLEVSCMVSWSSLRKKEGNCKEATMCGTPRCCVKKHVGLEAQVATLEFII